MKVLMISGDSNLLKAGAEGTEARKRFALQQGVVEQLDVFVWPQMHSKLDVWRAARKNHYDVITSQDPFWRGLLALKLAWLTGAKLNVQVHADLAAQSFVKHTLARIVLRHADSIRAVSEKVKAQVAASHVRAPIRVLPVFIEIERFKGLERKLGTQKVILWVGRFESEKNPLRAISVLREVRSAGVDARLILLGSGSLEKELHKSSEGLPVEFPGWQDPLKYLVIADVVLNTSPYESYGASIIEALAAGVPVVSRDVGVAREAGAMVVSDGELAHALVDTLALRKSGVLKLNVLSAPDWSRAWRETLI